MRVRAKFPESQFGFYGTKRRRDGDIFELESEDHFSEKWMEWVEPPKKKPGRPKSNTAETED